MLSPVNLADHFYTKPTGVPGGDYWIPKDPSVSLRDIFSRQTARDREKLQSFMEDVRENGTAVHLTEEQVRDLSERFKPNDMSYEDYHEFVDQLCEWGVLDHENAQYISISPIAEGLTPVDFLEPTATVTSARTDRYFNRDFSSSGGNVLDWARYMATFEGINPVTGGFEKTRSAILFGKIRDVLEMIS